MNKSNYVELYFNSTPSDTGSTFMYNQTVQRHVALHGSTQIKG